MVFMKKSTIKNKNHLRNNIFEDIFIHQKEWEKEYMVVDFTPYKTKAGKIMSHIVLSDKDKNLTRAIVFPSMYKISLAKMREGMKCRVVLSKLDDGTMNVKEIK